MAHTHISTRVGWLYVGQDERKWREIDLLDEARQPLYAYLQATGDPGRTYVFTSQRRERLTEQGIYYWFRTLKAQGTNKQWEVIEELTFNDLRHDFAYRSREAGWSLEEAATYLGDVSRQGVPTIQSSIGSRPVSLEQVKRKLKLIKG